MSETTNCLGRIFLSVARFVILTVIMKLKILKSILSFLKQSVCSAKLLKMENIQQAMAKSMFFLCHHLSSGRWKALYTDTTARKWHCGWGQEVNCPESPPTLKF